MINGLHFTDCGLDNVYLLDGYEIIETGYGPAPVIKDPAELHHAITAHILGLRELDGKTAAFLRAWLGMSVDQIAQITDLQTAQVRAWQRRPDAKVPAKAAAKIRQKCLDRIGHRFKPITINGDGPIKLSRQSGRWSTIS